MKSVKAFFLVAMLSFTAFAAFANTEPTNRAAKVELQKQVNQLIVQGLQDLNLEEDVDVMIKFMVTPDSKLIVLETNSDDLDGKIKRTLNYESVNVSQDIINEVFFIPVKLTIK